MFIVGGYKKCGHFYRMAKLHHFCFFVNGGAMKPHVFLLDAEG